MLKANASAGTAESNLIGSSRRLMSLLASTNPSNAHPSLAGLICPLHDLPTQRALVKNPGSADPALMQLDPSLQALVELDEQRERDTYTAIGDVIAETVRRHNAEQQRTAAGAPEQEDDGTPHESLADMFAALSDGDSDTDDARVAGTGRGISLSDLQLMDRVLTIARRQKRQQRRLELWQAPVARATPLTTTTAGRAGAAESDSALTYEYGQHLARVIKAANNTRPAANTAPAARPPVTSVAVQVAPKQRPADSLQHQQQHRHRQRDQLRRHVLGVPASTEDSGPDQASGSADVHARTHTSPTSPTRSAPTTPASPAQHASRAQPGAHVCVPMETDAHFRQRAEARRAALAADLCSEAQQHEAEMRRRRERSERVLAARARRSAATRETMVEGEGRDGTPREGTAVASAGLGVGAGVSLGVGAVELAAALLVEREDRIRSHQGLGLDLPPELLAPADEYVRERFPRLMAMWRRAGGDGPRLKPRRERGKAVARAREEDEARAEEDESPMRPLPAAPEHLERAAMEEAEEEAEQDRVGTERAVGVSATVQPQPPAQAHPVMYVSGAGAALPARARVRAGELQAAAAATGTAGAALRQGHSALLPSPLGRQMQPVPPVMTGVTAPHSDALRAGASVIAGTAEAPARAGSTAAPARSMSPRSQRRILAQYGLADTDDTSVPRSGSAGTRAVLGPATGASKGTGPACGDARVGADDGAAARDGSAHKWAQMVAPPRLPPLGVRYNRGLQRALAVQAQLARSACSAPVQVVLPQAAQGLDRPRPTSPPADARADTTADAPDVVAGMGARVGGVRATDTGSRLRHQASLYITQADNDAETKHTVAQAHTHAGDEAQTELYAFVRANQALRAKQLQQQRAEAARQEKPHFSRRPRPTRAATASSSSVQTTASPPPRVPLSAVDDPAHPLFHLHAHTELYSGDVVVDMHQLQLRSAVAPLLPPRAPDTDADGGYSRHAPARRAARDSTNVDSDEVDLSAYARNPALPPALDPAAYATAANPVALYVKRICNDHSDDPAPVEPPEPELPPLALLPAQDDTSERVQQARWYNPHGLGHDAEAVLRQGLEARGIAFVDLYAEERDEHQQRAREVQVERSGKNMDRPSSPTPGLVNRGMSSSSSTGKLSGRARAEAALLSPSSSLSTLYTTGDTCAPAPPTCAIAASGLLRGEVYAAKQAARLAQYQREQLQQQQQQQQQLQQHASLASLQSASTRSLLHTSSTHALSRASLQLSTLGATELAERAPRGPPQGEDARTYLVPEHLAFPPAPEHVREYYGKEADRERDRECAAMVARARESERAAREREHERLRLEEAYGKPMNTRPSMFPTSPTAASPPATPPNLGSALAQLELSLPSGKALYTTAYASVHGKDTARPSHKAFFSWEMRGK